MYGFLKANKSIDPTVSFLPFNLVASILVRNYISETGPFLRIIPGVTIASFCILRVIFIAAIVCVILHSLGESTVAQIPPVEGKCVVNCDPPVPKSKASLPDESSTSKPVVDDDAERKKREEEERIREEEEKKKDEERKADETRDKTLKQWKPPRFSKGTKDSAPVSVPEYNSVTGKAFTGTEKQMLIEKIENKEWPIETKAQFLLGVIYLERGGYDRALGFFRDALAKNSDEQWIKDTIDYVIELKAKQVLRNTAGFVARGVVDEVELAKLPTALRNRVTIAVSLVDGGDFDGALEILEEAATISPGNRSINGSKVYVRQLLAQRHELLSVEPETIRAQRMRIAQQRGKRDAAIKLGLHLADHDFPLLAAAMFAQAQTGFSRDEYMYRLTEKLAMTAATNKWKSSKSIPAFTSKANAILDALQYGAGDIEESISYLKYATEAEPNNENLREAFEFVAGMKEDVAKP